MATVVYETTTNPHPTTYAHQSQRRRIQTDSDTAQLPQLAEFFDASMRRKLAKDDQAALTRVSCVLLAIVTAGVALAMIAVSLITLT